MCFKVIILLSLVHLEDFEKKKKKVSYPNRKEEAGVRKPSAWVEGWDWT